MSRKYEKEKTLQTMSLRIGYIQEICKDYGGIVKALEDERNGQASIIMHLVVAKEQLQRIQDNGDLESLSIFEKDDIKGLSAIRNIASHDYEGLNFAIIENVIREYLPPLKERIDNFLNDMKQSEKSIEDILHGNDKIDDDKSESNSTKKQKS